MSPNLPPNSGTLRFQLDGATTHTAVNSIAALRRLFPQRVISRFGDVPWPPRSPDLTAPDFSVGLFNKKSVQYSPYRLTCTQKTIREEIAKISEETHLCIEEGGGHLKDIVQKSETVKKIKHHSNL